MSDKDTGKLEDSRARGTNDGIDITVIEKDGPRPALFIAGICGLIVIFAFLLTPLFDALIGLHIFWRIVLAIILLAPMGILLGFPFPLGIRLLGEGDASGAELIPYAYGLNGALGVLGSVVALVLALAYGFTFSIFIAVILYLLAALLSLIKPEL